MHIFTADHSNLEFEDFAEMIEVAGVTSIMDMRRFPESRKCLWFSGNRLVEHLPTCGVACSRGEDLTGVGVDVNVKILGNFATYIAPVSGWQPNREGSVVDHPID